MSLGRYILKSYEHDGMLILHKSANLVVDLSENKAQIAFPVNQGWADTTYTPRGGLSVTNLRVTEVCLMGTDSTLFSKLEDLFIAILEQVVGRYQLVDDSRGLIFEGPFLARYSRAPHSGKLVLRREE